MNDVRMVVGKPGLRRGPIPASIFASYLEACGIDSKGSNVEIT